MPASATLHDGHLACARTWQSPHRRCPAWHCQTTPGMESRHMEHSHSSEKEESDEKQKTTLGAKQENQKQKRRLYVQVGSYSLKSFCIFFCIIRQAPCFSKGPVSVRTGSGQLARDQHLITSMGCGVSNAATSTLQENAITCDTCLRGYGDMLPGPPRCDAGPEPRYPAQTCLA